MFFLRIHNELHGISLDSQFGSDTQKGWLHSFLLFEWIFFSSRQIVHHSNFMGSFSKKKIWPVGLLLVTFILFCDMCFPEIFGILFQMFFSFCASVDVRFKFLQRGLLGIFFIVFPCIGSVYFVRVQVFFC